MIWIGKCIIDHCIVITTLKLDCNASFASHPFSGLCVSAFCVCDMHKYELNEFIKKMKKTYDYWVTISYEKKSTTIDMIFSKCSLIASTILKIKRNWYLSVFFCALALEVEKWRQEVDFSLWYWRPLYAIPALLGYWLVSHYFF